MAEAAIGFHLPLHRLESKETPLSPVLECGICNERYNPRDVERKARRLTCCDNTCCTTCLDKLVNAGLFVCPFCRREYSSKGATFFPLCRVTMKLVDSICVDCRGQIVMSDCARCRSRLCSVCCDVNTVPPPSVAEIRADNRIETLKKLHEKLGEMRRERNEVLKLSEKLTGMVKNIETSMLDKIGSVIETIELAMLLAASDDEDFEIDKFLVENDFKSFQNDKLIAQNLVKLILSLQEEVDMEQEEEEEEEEEEEMVRTLRTSSSEYPPHSPRPQTPRLGVSSLGATIANDSINSDEVSSPSAQADVPAMRPQSLFVPSPTMNGQLSVRPFSEVPDSSGQLEVNANHMVQFSPYRQTQSVPSSPAGARARDSHPPGHKLLHPDILAIARAQLLSPQVIYPSRDGDLCIQLQSLSNFKLPVVAWSVEWLKDGTIVVGAIDEVRFYQPIAQDNNNTYKEIICSLPTQCRGSCTGLAVAGEDYLLVSVCGPKFIGLVCIHIRCIQEPRVFQYTSGGGDGQVSVFANPIGIAAVQEGHRAFIADSKRDSVLVCSVPQLLLEFELGGAESGTPYLLKRPWGVSVNGYKLFVSGAHGVKIFTSNFPYEQLDVVGNIKKDTFGMVTSNSWNPSIIFIDQVGFIKGFSAEESPHENNVLLIEQVCKESLRNTEVRSVCMLGCVLLISHRGTNRCSVYQGMRSRLI